MERVVVVGSGAAGLTAALTAAENADREVVLVTKATLGESNTLYAQGGVAAALFDDDSVDAHVADTVRAGAGLTDPRAARLICEEGPARIRDLIALGAGFDRGSDGELERGLEAAHSASRVVHAGGDATGRAIIAALTAAVRASRVEVHEHCVARDIVVRHGSVAGLCVIRGAHEFELAADAIVIATGGVGQLYRYSSNPPGATGDGVAAAMRAGARLVDAEFVQFHPTTLAVPGTPLVSEAVRGEGAVLRDAAGRRFMLDVHPDAELAPRDVVARAIARQMELQAGAPVLLDACALGERLLRSRFPGFWSLAATHGLDPSTEAVPVTPAAHYWMGGIEVDLDGRTAVPGLFAVGEAACTRAHGANRLASNSLLEALVTGHRAAQALGTAWPAWPDAAAPEHPEGGRLLTRERLQQLMWDRVGLHRDADGLEEARCELADAVVRGSTVPDLETGNLLLIARELVAAASARRGSVGAHYRTDDIALTATPAVSDREVPIAC
ncbi:L-aspartate oxidase [Salinibacterium sp. SYSU T00001]|uniref:L-aspartate oxidase n=1 Tax=Homoserinimonas sedimenticola TaxID=2986805 RepID=UPI0022364A56|nr:L-aspartate oxidase [Salinibacterium sedimenticola]MCW4384577.1 L-aspartate oxidase [Salinibacterium sedimenticola]